MKTYYESGELKVTVNYVDGVTGNIQTQIYESGSSLSTANYVDGLAQGEWKSFYKSGELRIYSKLCRWFKTRRRK